VHAYLMYGFPTQTAQETIDSLEIVRQLFETSVLQSAFWHLFTMTAHSPVGLNPEKFSVKRVSELVGSFANNDLEHIDPTGADHEQFSFGLKKALFNYMHANCFDYPLQKWFDFKVPRTSIPADYIRQAIDEPEYYSTASNAKVVWLGKSPRSEIITKSKKGSQWEVMSLTFQTLKSTISLSVDPTKGAWLVNMLSQLSIDNPATMTFQMLRENYEKAGLEDFELFWDNKPVNTLFKAGLLRI
ncbi:MAG TPA: hypothetical protein VLC28_09830, partial [Flavitalea sp.]|nr:hypothetical protein [Flavitalea sp.]